MVQFPALVLHPTHYLFCVVLCSGFYTTCEFTTQAIFVSIFTCFWTRCAPLGCSSDNTHLTMPSVDTTFLRRARTRAGRKAGKAIGQAGRSRQRQEEEREMEV